jgi:hypothetical protein
MLPREGHLKAAKIILTYLKKIQRGVLLMIEHIQTILLTPLKVIPTGRTSIQMLKKKLLHVERTIAIYDLFWTISTNESCNPILSKMECNIIQIIPTIVTVTKILFSLM